MMLVRRPLIHNSRRFDRLSIHQASFLCGLSGAGLIRWCASHPATPLRDDTAKSSHRRGIRCSAVNDVAQVSSEGAAAGIRPNVVSVGAEPEVYSLEKTQALVATAMFAAVSGLAYVLSTVMKLESSVGYFLPLPIILSALRPSVPAGWKTMVATAILIVVLLGPMRALTYITLHGLLAATLGTMWRAQLNWWLSISVGAFVRMSGQMVYLLMTSVAMNENFFAIMVANTQAMLEQLSVAVGWSGTPSTLVVSCSILALVLVNSYCYVVLLHVIYRILLQSMGYRLGEMPGIVAKALNIKGREEALMRRG